MSLINAANSASSSIPFKIKFQYKFAGYENIVRLLIENRADVNIVDSLNCSALILALNGGINS